MATIVASIEYLVHEILLRLPVRSLLRFKCVSKQWLSLISEPKFCHLHTLRLYRTTRVFPSALLLAPVNSPTCPVMTLKSNKVSDSSNFHIVQVPKGTIIQSCNGLVLIRRRSWEDISEVEYSICNPTTNQAVPVIFPSRQYSSSVMSLFICFEPLKSPHYKLVSFRFKCIDSTFDPRYVMNVYSSETSSWSERGLSFIPPRDKPPDRLSTVFFNGALYWYNEYMRKCIYFDLETQTFKPCPFPMQLENGSVLYFGKSGGHLHFVLESSFEYEYDILELNEENSGFSLKFHLNLWESSLQPEFFFPYCLVKQENDDDSMLVIYLDEKILIYNIVNSTFSDLSSNCPYLIEGSNCYVHEHYENLSSVTPT